MSTATLFECPNCGAALQPTGADAEITCSFCGTVVTVPETLRNTSGRSSRTMTDGQAAPDRYQPPQTAPYQPLAPVQPVVYPTRRRGAGCFSVLLFFTILALLGLGLFVAIAPDKLNGLLTQVNSVAKSAAADISIFSVDPSQVANNGVVTLRWAINLPGSSATVSLERISAGTTVTLLRNLPSVGNYPVTVQGKPGDKVTFRLVTSYNGATSEKTVTVTLR